MTITKSLKSNLLLRTILYHTKYVMCYSTTLSHGNKIKNTGDDDIKLREDMSDNSKSKQLYLHIAPCGDYWTGHEIFAAKHLQPDYVKSIPVPIDFDPDTVFESLDDDDDDAVAGILKRLYDENSDTISTSKFSDLVNNASHSKKKQ